MTCFFNRVLVLPVVEETQQANVLQQHLSADANKPPVHFLDQDFCSSACSSTILARAMFLFTHTALQSVDQGQAERGRGRGSRGSSLGTTRRTPMRSQESI